ncbi:CHAD domain-containing protein [Dokdonella sp.]|uniref:CHAD domain-containing protein n=1 Tax=Dokdonella sp. TaxID=2291710 RepID=UPI0032645DF7
MDQPSSVPASSQESIGLHLRDYACAELGSSIAHLSWRGGRLHEGVHLARKSLRRTRATIELGGCALGSGASLIDRELRRANRSLSKLRDAHATLHALDQLVSRNAGDEHALQALRRIRTTAARVRAACLRSVLAGDPRLQDRLGVLAILRAALPALAWAAVDPALVEAAIGRTRLAADDAGAKACQSGRDDDWHAWRRRARRLSQQQRARGDVIAKSAGKREKRLAILLGEAQDYAMLRERAGRKSPFARDDRDLLRSLATDAIADLRKCVARISTKEPAATPK